MALLVHKSENTIILVPRVYVRVHTVCMYVLYICTKSFHNKVESAFRVCAYMQHVHSVNDTSVLC